MVIQYTWVLPKGIKVAVPGAMWTSASWWM